MLHFGFMTVFPKAVLGVDVTQLAINTVEECSFVLTPPFLVHFAVLHPGASLGFGDLEDIIALQV